MEESEADNIVRLYESLEQQVLDFQRYIPPIGANLLAWSPRLATVITEACAVIDSIFRLLSPPHLQVGRRRVSRGKYNISHFYRIYQDFGFQDKKVIFLSSPPEYRSPFAEWTYTATPDWWSTYNLLKHDRVTNMEQATFGEAIDALAGLLLVLAFTRNRHLTTALMRRDFLDFRVNPQIVFEWAERGYSKSGGVSLQTSLFAVILTSNVLPDRIEDFRPALFGGFPRLITFFGRI